MEYSSSDDRTLVHAFRNGDERAFEEIVRRYQRQVANVLYLTLGGREEVEDLSQEVFIRVHRSVGRVSVDVSLFSWIYRIALNLAIDELRRRKVKKILSLDFFSASPSEKENVLRDHTSASDRVLAEEKREQILTAIGKLSAAYRAALVLREYEGLSYKEIAGLLQITEQAVKSRIFRAREELKKHLSGYFKERL
ncbi:MAG: sigma-70 family RNA polymerase sigma factor [Ignavibacteriales bacterium]|nr:sigma-70 family RNA polymerase sigma factor [Ignavibacteriales bacterium]